MTDDLRADRLTEDDRTTAAAEQFLARALLNHRARPAADPRRMTPGVCACCGDACDGHYCDAGCEAKHLRRGRAA